MKGGRDILSEYGKDIPHPQAPRATSGGVTRPETLNYHPPQGPTNMHQSGPGIHGDNHGNARCPVASRGETGHRGIGGTTHRGGSQRG